jgi:hypothetical protein
MRDTPDPRNQIDAFNPASLPGFATFDGPAGTRIEP